MLSSRLCLDRLAGVFPSQVFGEYWFFFFFLVVSHVQRQFSSFNAVVSPYSQTTNMRDRQFNSLLAIQMCMHYINWHRKEICEECVRWFDEFAVWRIAHYFCLTEKQETGHRTPSMPECTNRWNLEMCPWGRYPEEWVSDMFNIKKLLPSLWL